MNRRRALFLVLWIAAISAIATWAWLREQPTANLTGRCDGRRFAIDTVEGGTAPYIKLTADDTRGAFLLDYGATASTLSAERFGNRKAGGTVSRFDLPSFPTAHFRLTRYWTSKAPPGGQLGVIGTDFLSLLTLDISYRTPRPDVVISAKPCAARTIADRKLVPIHQTGFFSRTPSRLPAGRLNVPVVFLKLGKVQVWAQFDTGYDDLQRRPSIDINEALFNQLTTNGVTLSSVGTIQVSTCAGSETRPVYRTPAATVVTETGAIVRDLGPVYLVRKSATSCGGIATIDEPAAQVAASLLARLGELVFDPHNETLWVAPE